MEPRLRLERFPPQAGLEPGTARSVGQRLTTELPGLLSWGNEKTHFLQWLSLQEC